MFEDEAEQIRLANLKQNSSKEAGNTDGADLHHRGRSSEQAAEVVNVSPRLIPRHSRPRAPGRAGRGGVGVGSQKCKTVVW